MEDDEEWPSTADPRVLAAISSHRWFYSDSDRLPRLTCCLSDTKKLIFAVYIYYDDRVIFSKVLEMETVSDPFLSRPLKLSFLGSGETVPITPLKYDTDDCTSLAKQHLRVSWIVDPSTKRAVNIASHKAVNYDLSQCSDRVDLSYATVAAAATGKLVEFSVLITCDRKGREIIVKHVKMEIMDEFQFKDPSGRRVW
ncbi:F-box protein At2g27310-like [Henckelia pumila]|uniref:F-box protein At2g27310-like n=1 Tax=Henckelia pumila TaxID=405737 RepID=UPI003C6E7378